MGLDAGDVLARVEGLELELRDGGDVGDLEGDVWDELGEFVGDLLGAAGAEGALGD